MKTKLFIILLIIISALIVLGDDIKTIDVNKTISFELEEDSTKDGYKWFIDIGTNKNVRATSKNTTQKEKDTFALTFTKRGEYNITFNYSSIKNKKEISKTITQTFKVIENVTINWCETFEEAKEKAKKENKRILILFTGSDWCGPCKSLEANIIQTKEFEKFANNNLILYKADFPKHTEQKIKTRMKNNELKQKYPIPGYPCTYIINADGVVKGKINGYEKNYITYIKRYLGK